MLSILLLAASQLAAAPAFMQPFIDKQDGWLDGSDWIVDNAYGFLPVPIIITEPAVGQGLGLAGVFIHAKEGQFAEPSEGFARPSVTAVAAAYTSNDSWFAGGAHLGVWKDDRIRYLGVVGYASVNLKFFGSAGASGNGPLANGLNFNGEGLFVDQNIRFRIGSSDWFIGPKYQYLDLQNRFDLGSDIPGIEQPELNARTSGIGAIAEFDSLDSNFTPNRGQFAQLDFLVFNESIGSDFDYERYNAKYQAFLGLAQKLVLGLRIDGQLANGDTPFYALPFIGLRGIPALRYQGEAVLTAETEARWDFHPRVSAIGFLGAGRAAQSAGNISDASTRVAKGLGLRYLLARKLSLRAGIDIAWGPEDRVWYLSIGQAWR